MEVIPLKKNIRYLFEKEVKEWERNEKFIVYGNNIPIDIDTVRFLVPGMQYFYYTFNTQELYSKGRSTTSDRECNEEFILKSVENAQRAIISLPVVTRGLPTRKPKFASSILHTKSDSNGGPFEYKLKWNFVKGLRISKMDRHRNSSNELRSRLICLGFPWETERLLWIGHKDKQSPFSHLPREIIREIIHQSPFLATDRKTRKRRANHIPGK